MLLFMLSVIAFETSNADISLQLQPNLKLPYTQIAIKINGLTKIFFFK